MKQPIDTILDQLEWKPLRPPEQPGELPYATHEGVLQFTESHPLRVYQLSDGRRIIDADDMAEFFAPAWTGPQPVEDGQP